MTAIGRAMMARPKMVLLDEPSMGGASQIVRDLHEQAGMSIRLAAQSTRVALKEANCGCTLESGRIMVTVRLGGWPTTRT